MMLAMLPAMSRGHRRPRVAIVESGSFAAPDLLGPVTFEDSSAGALANLTPSYVTLGATDQAFSGTRSAKLHYVEAFQNVSLDFEMLFAGAPANNVSEAYFLWAVRFGTAVPGTEPDQRKLLYLKGDIYNNADWQATLTGFNYGTQIGYSNHANGENISQRIDPGFVYTPSAWYAHEYRLKLNTPGASDGIIELWIYSAARATVFHQQWAGLNIKGASTHKIETAEFGKQTDSADSTGGALIDEYRHLDYICASTQRIGPPP